MHLPNDSDVSRKPGNTDTPSVANGSVSEKASTALETVADNPGLMQLVICVLGIYAAL
jgi:UDP-galactose transporter B1